MGVATSELLVGVIYILVVDLLVVVALCLVLLIRCYWVVVWVYVC